MLEQGLGETLARLVMQRRPMLCVTTVQVTGAAPSALPLLPAEYAAVTSRCRPEMSIRSSACRRALQLCYEGRSGVIRHSVPYTTR